MTKYLYLLVFKSKPLFKIGIGTKNNNSSYDRILTHIKTYGDVFDLTNSYEIIIPIKYSVNALETQLKDITKHISFYDELILDYKGKDGATEIRHIKSLDCALSLIKFQQTFIPLEIKKGINVMSPIIRDRISLKTTDKYNVLKQLSKIETHLDNYYIPNMDKVNSWRVFTCGRWQNLELIFTNESFLFDLGLHETQEKESIIRYGISFEYFSGRNKNWVGFSLISYIEKKNNVYTIRFMGPIRENEGFNEDFYKYLDDVMESESIENWFIRVFIKPLDKKKENALGLTTGKAFDSTMVEIK